ncbi:MAG: formylmethanofuran dehydrogenase subunit C [Methylotenera sp.]|nr:MAG: formylmethanofuran dehydrogenase subunit C [Methylotenera sp.]
MSALTFTLKKIVTQQIDCRLLTSNNLAYLSIVQIKNLYLLNTQNAPKISDYFDVSGDDANHIIFKNANQQLHYIGHQMTHGQITVEGNCGDFLGHQMRGGILICKGNANDRVGDHMRRGLILIDGNAGNYCGSRLIAGTIGVFGDTGNYVGFAMKRGTILLTKTPKLHATLQDCGMHTLPFLALLFASFKGLSTRFNKMKNLRAKRFAGDLACNGNGEILICDTTISA